MTAETEADRASFLSTDEFGQAATYAPVAGGSAEIAGVFDDPHLVVFVAGSAPSSDARPTFLCRSADLPAGAAGGDAGDTLTIGADVYRVVDLEPDGTGMTLIRLGR